MPLFDGDLVFALSTGARPAGDVLAQMCIGHLAADWVARAIARAVYHAGPRVQPPAYREVWREASGQRFRSQSAQQADNHRRS